jgi:hydroxymethylglutaryl-CoA synthase
MSTTKFHSTKVGIDDLSVYIPKLKLPIAVLAEQRDLEYAKLNKGLGLEAMSVADAHEDVATMAANAVLDLMLKNNIHPQEVGRIYVGTESAVDGSKPTASYVVDMLTQYFNDVYGPDCLLNCDVVDMTFACIGAVDALQNTLEWVSNGDQRVGIVVGSDIAKYELGSGGEYTQGAGAVAMLVKNNPRILAISEEWGVATRSVHDFFKPLRKLDKKALIEAVLKLSGQPDTDAADVLSKLHESGVLDSQEQWLHLHKETPVFDGPYSNDCYRNRIWEALQDYARKNERTEAGPVTDDWYRMIFHLPYAFQARRMFSEIFMLESQRRGDWGAVAEELSMDIPAPADFDNTESFEKAYAAFLRAVSKTSRYKKFVAEKIEKGERASSLVGNLYTSSIFLALASTLTAALDEERGLTDAVFGFFSYGSGSKSKVFTGQVQAGWQDRTRAFGLMDMLNNRTTLSYRNYDLLHRNELEESIKAPEGEFYLADVCMKKGVQEGARTYLWKARNEKEANTTA